MLAIEIAAYAAFKAAGRRRAKKERHGVGGQTWFAAVEGKVLAVQCGEEKVFLANWATGRGARRTS